MSGTGTPARGATQKARSAAERRERLAAELRANLKKRKHRQHGTAPSVTAQAPDPERKS